MSYEKSVSYFKHLENLENIRHTNSPDLVTKVSVTSSVSKSSNNPKYSNMWCHYCDKKNHNIADCRATSKVKQQKNACFEAKAGPRKKPLVFFLKLINAVKSMYN
jgi:hypothetical protein